MKGVCRYNPGVNPEEDCARPARWHVRYAETCVTVLACDAHFGSVLDPLVVNGVRLEKPIGEKSFHAARGACLEDGGPLATWWVDQVSCCVTEEEGVELGVLAYEAERSWVCGYCGEETRCSHYRSNSDGTVRHDPFGINHSPFPKGALAAELSEFYSGLAREEANA